MYECVSVCVRVCVGVCTRAVPSPEPSRGAQARKQKKRARD